MRNIRIWFRKDNACRFISHLDVYRAVMRALLMSGVPIWHTEGYNSRPYVSFALPLSLGFRGLHETVDIRLVDEEYRDSDIMQNVNDCLPNGIEIYRVTEPKMKPSAIAYASYTVRLSAEEMSVEDIEFNCKNLLSQNEILAEKKTKKGIKQVDIKQSLVKYSIENEGGCVHLELLLPAGSEVNVNPMLFAAAIEEKCGCELFADVTRAELYNREFTPFE